MHHAVRGRNGEVVGIPSGSVVDEPKESNHGEQHQGKNRKRRGGCDGCCSKRRAKDQRRCQCRRRPSCGRRKRGGRRCQECWRKEEGKKREVNRSVDVPWCLRWRRSG